MMHNRQERQGPPERMFNIHTPTVRPPTQMDIYVENAIAFARRLLKQLTLTLCASLFRAAAEWLLKSGDDGAKSTLMDNMKNDGSSSNNNGSSYRNSAPASTYNQDNGYYNRYRQSNGSETFPGFSN